MTHRIWFETSGDTPTMIGEAREHTSTVAPLWYSALGMPLTQLMDGVAGDNINLLRKAVNHIEQHTGYYIAIEPVDGFEGAQEVLQWMLEMSIRNPKAMIRMAIT
jgi:hypothetical protein